jgi:hypothetical protein
LEEELCSKELDYEKCTIHDIARFVICVWSLPREKSTSPTSFGRSFTSRFAQSVNNVAVTEYGQG